MKPNTNVAQCYNAFLYKVLLVIIEQISLEYVVCFHDSEFNVSKLDHRLIKKCGTGHLSYFVIIITPLDVIRLV